LATQSPDLQLLTCTYLPPEYLDARLSRDAIPVRAGLSIRVPKMPQL
jgi:hypothetical protein